MRGQINPQGCMFYVLDVEARIRPDHPLRAIKKLVDADLARLSPLFQQAYAAVGRPSVPPEQLLKALLLQALYAIRSERQLVERLDTDLLFRWFLDLDPAAPVFDATVFTYNRPRLDGSGLTAAFFNATVRRIVAEGLASPEHFSVDGTLIEAYASIKSFRPHAETGRDEPDCGPGGFKSVHPEMDFHGQKRSNATHRSRTDPEARLYKKSPGQGAKLCHMGHLLTENRHGLVLAVGLSTAAGNAEPAAALALLDAYRQHQGQTPRTCGADKGYDAGPFLRALEERAIVPHVAVRNYAPGAPRLRAHQDPQAVAARQRMQQRLGTVGYRLSQKARKKGEQAFGWIKDFAGLARTRLVGQWKILQQLQVTAAAYNLVRVARLRAV